MAELHRDQRGVFQKVTFDALVAGAGPAGSTVALLLARAGREVAVCERTAFPRTKACGEYLSTGSVRLLHDLGLGERLAPHAHPIRGVRLHGHGVHTRIDFPAPGWSLPRSLLDSVLLDAALEAGASLVHARVEDCADGVESAGVGLRMPDGSIARGAARTLVGADGIHSLIARKCGFSGRRSRGARFALGGHYNGFRALDEYIDMFVDGRTYAAINPLGPSTANVMLVVDESELERHRSDAGAFAQERARRLAGDLLDGAQLEGKGIAVGPLAYRANAIAGHSVMLVGDAACFVDPFTGQGVYLAMRCAQIAAGCILSGGIADYASRAGREIAARERAAHRVRHIVGSPAIARAAALLQRYNAPFFAPLVRRVTGTV